MALSFRKFLFLFFCILSFVILFSNICQVPIGCHTIFISVSDTHLVYLLSYPLKVFCIFQTLTPSFMPSLLWGEQSFFLHQFFPGHGSENLFFLIVTHFIICPLTLILNSLWSLVRPSLPCSDDNTPTDAARDGRPCTTQTQ